MSDTTATTTSNDTTTTVAAPAAPVRLSDSEQEAAVEALLSGKTIEPEKAPEPAPGREPAAEAAPDAPTEGEHESETTSDADDPSVDYAQEIPLANGEKLTLGQLKDFYQESAQREVAMIERENKVMQQSQELQEMAGYLNLPPEAKQKIAQQQLQYLQGEHAAMLNAIPEFKDQAAFEKGRLAIFELGKEYGVDTSRVTDHRVVKMLHDFGRLKAQIKGARAGLKQVKAPEPKAIVQHTGKATELTNAVNRAKQTGNIADQTAAVDLLLRG